MRNFIYILHVGRYRSRVLLSIILILGYDLEVKVTVLEISYKSKKKKKIASKFILLYYEDPFVGFINIKHDGIYIGLNCFSAPSPSWGMAFKSRSQTFQTNVIFAYIMKTDFTGIW